MCIDVYTDNNAFVVVECVPHAFDWSSCVLHHQGPRPQTGLLFTRPQQQVPEIRGGLHTKTRHRRQDVYSGVYCHRLVYTKNVL